MQPDLILQPEPFVWRQHELDDEILDGGAFAGLTTAEQKALAITSTLETGHRGGFYGLSGNFDKMGLSFGLVNWNIGSGSLQPLLGDFLQRFPARWQAAFREDADGFAALLAQPKAQQLAVVNRDMNVRKVVNGKKRWVINDHWSANFRRLANDPEFQKIQVRFAGDLLSRAKYFCDYFGFRTERAFCMMFDAVSSSGKWWLSVKNRQGVLRAKLAVLAMKYGSAVPERDKLRAIAETLGETSLPEWRDRVLVRKLWFLGGRHPREKELAGLEPTDAPFTTSAVPVAATRVSATPSSLKVDPVLDIGIISAFVQGHRDRGDLTSTVFLQRHPERKGRAIAKEETAAIAEWRGIRARVDQLFPKLDGADHELEISPSNEQAIATPIVMLLLAKGERDPNKLASEAFYALHRERDRKPIGRGETEAAAQWKRLRTWIIAKPLAGFRNQLPPARLVKRETGAGGTTLYYELRLGHEGQARPLTAVFVPDGYRPTATVDVIVYMHGHRAGHYANGETMAIDRYLREEKSARIREGVVNSGKNAILIAPTLGPQSQASGLTRGGLDRYLENILGAAASEIGNGKLDHLVLSGHSGAGVWMNWIATGPSTAVAQNLRECWGFDCFYTPKVDVTWIDWARKHPDKKLWAYWGTNKVYESAKQLARTKWNPVPENIVLTQAHVDSARTAHFDTVKNHFGERVAGASFIAAR